MSHQPSLMDPLSYLFGLEQFGIKFGLDNISTLVARLGHPEHAFRSVHIAGTNGKGSVTAMVDAALRAAGHRSGRYTSPHLVDLRRFADGREVLMDAAHNPAGAAALASYLAGLTRRDRFVAKPPLVFAVMRDKDVEGMFSALLPAVGSVVLTRASTARSADPDELAAIARRMAPDRRVAVEPSPADALAVAWRDARRIVVAGSIFLLGDVMKLIGAP